MAFGNLPAFSAQKFFPDRVKIQKKQILTNVYKIASVIHMNDLRRKQLILPQSKLNQVKKALGAKTDTEAVLLSLESVLRQKKMESFARLPEKLRLSITQSDLKRMRRD